MGIVRMALLAALAAACCPGAARADDLVFGSHVRVQLEADAQVPFVCLDRQGQAAAGCRRVDGTLIEARRDGSLVVSLRGHETVVTVPDTAVAVLEVGVERSRSRGAAQGAALGTLAGVMAGVVWGAASSGHGSCDGSSSFPLCFEFTSGEAALLGGIFFGAIGAGAGAFIGGNYPGERWEVVRSRGVGKTVHFKVAPVRRGAAVAVAFAF